MALNNVLKGIYAEPKAVLPEPWTDAQRGLQPGDWVVIKDLR